MLIGILPNTTKENITETITLFAEKLEKSGFDYVISDNADILPLKSASSRFDSKVIATDEMFRTCDMVASIGGDGTMLHSAYLARDFSTPIMGINLGKLGFLAEFDMNSIDESLEEIKRGHYRIEERMVLEGECSVLKGELLFAANDIVIEKGGWPKMIEIELEVEGNYVTTFAADGLILATPTGSTGYSLSAGGPIVSPGADVITISPISPHSLTVRPLVLASNKRVKVRVMSQHTSVQINCDGNRVYSFAPPVDLVVYKSSRRLRLVHTYSGNYFKTLREKLFWGLDLRKF